MKRLLNTRVLAAAAGLMIFFLLWIFFAPIQVGGQSYYVIVNGNSMEPLFHKGDLVVLRSAHEYAVGDIVAYKYPGIGKVFHRIIEINGDHYQMKGDNNSWIDGYSPQKSEIIARYWFMIKGLGKAVGWLKSPWIIALIVGILCLMIGLSMINQPEEITKNKNNHSNNKLSYQIANYRNGYWWIIYAIGIIAIVLGIFAYTRPLTRSKTNKITYTQKGTFSYEGSAAQDVYDAKQIKTGDPIYTALTCNITYKFNYSLESAETFSGGGTYSILAELKANNGWKRSFTLVPKTQFSGNSFNSESSFNTCTLQPIIENTQKITQVENLQYSLVLIPVVKVSGQLAGHELNDGFSPQLSFTIDKSQIYLPEYDPAISDPIHPSAAGQVVLTSLESNTLPIFGLELPVGLARNIALIALFIALIGIIVPVFIFDQASRKDKKLQAKMLVGPMLVETQVSPVSGSERIVDLTSFEDLAALAERTNSAVFFHQQALYIDYLVRESSLVYRYRQMIALPEGKERSEIQNEIYRALKKDEFVLFYQPIYSLQDGRITQVEALLRWQHPTRGLLLASEFLPYTEKSKLICLIDNWVLQKACQQMREWNESGALGFALAINVSIQQLRDRDLARNIQDALLENQLTPNSLRIEISLDQLMFDAEVMNNLKQIRLLGINITVKSGTSSAINKLHQLEGVDQLKISRSLVKEVVSDPSAGDVTKNIIAEAHRNKVGVTAVGIETNEEMGFFRLNDCDGIQGNILSKPLPSGELKKILSSNKPSERK